MKKGGFLLTLRGSLQLDVVPWPSLPQRPSPQVKSAPSDATAAQWYGPQDTCDAWVTRAYTDHLYALLSAVLCCIASGFCSRTAMKTLLEATDHGFMALCSHINGLACHTLRRATSCECGPKRAQTAGVAAATQDIAMEFQGSPGR